MGVDAFPHCFDGVLCDVLNFVVRQLVYMPFAQNLIAPAGYFRDPANLATYSNSSVMLAALNNEKDTHNPTYVQKFAGLDGGLFVMFSNDTMIHPKETAHFQGHLRDHKTV